MTFSEHLLNLRTERGLLQRDVAKATGIGLQTYQRYEYGHREPQLSTLVALADFYDLSLDELVCRERPQRAKKKAGNLQKAAKRI